MAEFGGPICVGCGKNRMFDSNHWRILVVDSCGLHITEFDLERARKPESIIVCGDQCAIKKVSEFLHTGSMRMEPPMSNTLLEKM